MYFVFGLSKDRDDNTGIVVFVDRLSNMVHLVAVPDSIDGKVTAMLFIDRVFFQHGLPLAIISDCDSRFTGKVGLPSSRCLEPDFTCPQRITRRPIVKLSNLIVSPTMFFVVFELSRLRLGARCPLSLSLR